MIHFVAGRSFWIYLMHGLTQNWLAGWLNEGWLGDGIFGGSRPWMNGGAAGWGCWFVLSVLSFVMALGIGCVLDVVYKPVSRWLLKMDFKMFAEKEK